MNGKAYLATALLFVGHAFAGQQPNHSMLQRRPAITLDFATLQAELRKCEVCLVNNCYVTSRLGSTSYNEFNKQQKRLSKQLPGMIAG